MKNLLSILGIACACNIYAQYGNQDSIVIPISNKQNAVALIHLPDDYSTDTTTKHPLIVSLVGAGQYGTSAIKLTAEGVGKAIHDDTWNGNAVNPYTNQTEKFIAVSILSPYSTAPLSFSDLDLAYTWLYANYRIDTSCSSLTGLSRGGGAAVNYPSHVYGCNCCPSSYQYAVPSHTLAATIPMSAEILHDNPVNYIIADSVNVWGFGDTRGGDDHGTATRDFTQHIQAIDSNLARFTSYIGEGGGHCCWDRFYDASYTEKISGVSMNIYQFVLYHRRNQVNSIVTGIITGSPFCVTSTTGTSISVPYTSTGHFEPGNIFHAQLTTSTGSFTGAQYIGSVTTTADSGTINCTIPAGTATGVSYRIRVNSTTPHTIGSDNGSTFIIRLAASSIAPAGYQNINVGDNGNTLTVTEKSTPTARKWYYGNAPGDHNTSTGIRDTAYTPYFSAAGTYYVICQSYWRSCAVVQSNEVKINVSAGKPASLKNDLQSAFLVQSQRGKVICHYNLGKSAAVKLTIYDEYERARASFSVNQIEGSYTHTFDHHFPKGLYVVVLQTNQQETASQKILITNY